MAEFLDYDPVRGLLQTEAVEDGRHKIHYQQDVEPVLELTKIERNEGATDDGIGRDLWLYARVPPVVILKLKFEHGVDIYKKDHLKRAFDLINEHYPYCKTTFKHHDLKGKGWGL